MIQVKRKLWKLKRVDGFSIAMSLFTTFETFQIHKLKQFLVQFS